MSVGKNARLEGRQKLGPRAARPAVARSEGGVPVLVEEKVLAEIAHELGNFFHKLYYWSDYLKERTPRKTADSTAAEMLERTIKNLEDFLRLSFDYVHPLQLSFLRMGVADVVHGLLGQVRAQLNGTPATVAHDGEWCGEEVLVDPSHLSRVFEVTLRHMMKQVGAASTVCVAVGRALRAGRPGLELSFHVEGVSEASPLFRTSDAGVEWAVAQKVVALHGGELREQTRGPGEKSLVIFLPLCS